MEYTCKICNAKYLLDANILQLYKKLKCSVCKHEECIDLSDINHTKPNISSEAVSNINDDIITNMNNIAEQPALMNKISIKYIIITAMLVLLYLVYYIVI